MDMIRTTSLQTDINAIGVVGARNSNSMYGRGSRTGGVRGLRWRSWFDDDRDTGTVQAITAAEFPMCTVLHFGLRFGDHIGSLTVVGYVGATGGRLVS
jgi:hypothetical protein